MSSANLESVAAAAMSEEGGSVGGSPGAPLLGGGGGPGGRGTPVVTLEREAFFSSGTVTARLEPVPAGAGLELKPVAALSSALAAAVHTAGAAVSPPARLPAAARLVACPRAACSKRSRCARWAPLPPAGLLMHAP